MIELEHELESDASEVRRSLSSILSLTRLPGVTPTSMPTAIIAGPTIVRVGRTIQSPIAVPVTIVRRISAIVGWGISAIV